ncbi:MAG: glycosyltransferase family 2 protein [Lachnospiraceae bacterium]|nr:glycosyltransferase family 2 protein [Lachnospiraceae bacterium]
MQITIIVPTYNRKMTLLRTLQSIERQTVKDFFCIIVDDGSTDGTKQMIEEMRNELSFDFDYFYKENGGVLSARLFAIERAKTELIMPIDSDDELTEDAVEVCLKTWNSLSSEDKKKYYGLKCLCRDYETNKVLVGFFPDDINTCSYRRYFKADAHGERIFISRRDVFLQQHREYLLLMKEANSHFVPEGILHLKYQLQYRYYCINKVIRIYHREDPNSLSRSPMSKESCRISYFAHTYILKHFFPNEKLPLKLYFQQALYAIKFGLLLNYRMTTIFHDVGNTHNRVVLTLCLPFGIGNYLLGRKIVEQNTQ